MPVYPSNITSANADKLRKVWEYRTHGYVTARPLFEGNRVYVCDWQGYIYCLNAADGTLVYEKQIYQPPKGNPVLKAIPVVNIFLGEPLPYMWNGFAGTGCLDDDIWYLASVGGKRGSALKNGAPGKLYGIYAKDGSILWERPLGEYPYSGSLAVPICDDGELYVGLCSVEEPASVTYRLYLRSFKPQCVGEVFCFHKNSGQLKWHRRSTEFIQNDDSRAKGAGIWGGFSVDAETRSLYFATGNSYGRPVSKASDSVLCVDSRDGGLLWNYQAQAQDAWLPLNMDGPDFDFGCTPILFPCTSASSGYAVGAGNKNGMLYALDSKSGKLVWNANCHINSTPDDGIRSNITYQDGHIYIWSKNMIPHDSISLNCLDAESGRVIWNKIESGTNCMTTGAVTNDLYFMANYDGEIYALHVRDGERVWGKRDNQVSFGSDVAIWENALYAGFGVPRMYDGRFPFSGVLCYAVD